MLNFELDLSNVKLEKGYQTLWFNDAILLISYYLNTQVIHSGS